MSKLEALDGQLAITNQQRSPSKEPAQIHAEVSFVAAGSDAGCPGNHGPGAAADCSVATGLETEFPGNHHEAGARIAHLSLLIRNSFQFFIYTVSFPTYLNFLFVGSKAVKHRASECNLKPLSSKKTHYFVWLTKCKAVKHYTLPQRFSILQTWLLNQSFKYTCGQSKHVKEILKTNKLNNTMYQSQLQTILDKTIDGKINLNLFLNRIPGIHHIPAATTNPGMAAN